MGVGAGGWASKLLTVKINPKKNKEILVEEILHLNIVLVFNDLFFASKLLENNFRQRNFFSEEMTAYIILGELPVPGENFNPV